MIRWIQARAWLPEILISVAAFLLFGGIDLVAIGPETLLISMAICLSLLFTRKLYFFAPLLIVLGAGVQVFENIAFTASSIAIILASFISGGFAPRPWRELTLSSSVISLFGVGVNAVLNPAIDLEVIAGVTLTETGSLVAIGVLLVLCISSVCLAWILGILLMTRFTHVGTEFDRLVSEEKQLRLAMELAEQSKRFEIARDINEHLVQRISGVISNAEGGIYAGKTDPQAYARALERVSINAKEAHAELRRLFDMLNRGTVSEVAPPGLENLESLATAYRERGLEVSISHQGDKFELPVSAELAIYRIVFDALENVAKHTPLGTRATVEFTWLESGLQVLIKDNGVETERRSRSGSDGILDPYEAQEDLETLLEKVTGPGITAMRERAQAYGGSLEVNRVVGIGFTVSALFPVLDQANNDSI